MPNPNKPIIPNAPNLAEEVAKLIFEYSPKGESGKVWDVMLYGAALHSTARDIDLLLIHDVGELSEIELITKYEGGTMVPDPDAKKEKIEAGRILGAIDTARFDPSMFESPEDFFSARGCYREMVIGDTLDLNPPLYTYKFVQSPYGCLNIEIGRTDRQGRLKITIDAHLKGDRLVKKVNSLLGDNGQMMNDVLDLQMVHVGFLSQDGWYDGHRKAAISQSSDPTFWYDVLSAGKLFDKKAGRFSIPLGEIYPHAVELFKP
ncbi:MAG TPA: hypothetical protein VJI46_03320 [Candidatus Nanoarchaeia archaeon]|nr:hypothetical protein [Candidatus Nanoarchaeia archaeon]